jgi:hypothetical protein
MLLLHIPPGQVFIYLDHGNTVIFMGNRILGFCGSKSNLMQTAAERGRIKNFNICHY